MVEVVIERDEEGRVQAVTLHGDESAEGLAAAALVETMVLGLRALSRNRPGRIAVHEVGESVAV